MWVESIRYFNGGMLVEYTTGRKNVEFIQYEEGKNHAKVTMYDGKVIKIVSPFIEYQSKWFEEDSSDLKIFG